jgi:hypothetical protein
VVVTFAGLTADDDKDATFAVSTGIVHEVKNAQIPPGGPVFSLVFKQGPKQVMNTIEGVA